MMKAEPSMSKSLIITEKPSVAQDIVSALSGFSAHGSSKQGEEYWESRDYICTYAVGHILEWLEPEEIDATYKRWTLENLPIIPSEFKLKPKAGQTARVRTIKKLLERKDVDAVINACDAGREGELIFRELIKYLGAKKPMYRLWLQSMTPEAIREGFERLQEGRKYDGLGVAAECRSLADWLIGINGTRALTVRLRSKSHKQAWSTGRVQTPTLALLVDRELEILAHVPEPFWRVTAVFKAADHEYQAVWFDPEFQESETRPQAKPDRIFDQQRAQRIVAAVAGQFGLASETRKPSRESAPPLFDLTSLQRESNRRFGWSAARTLQAAQRCYERHKVLTYPRTDSRCLPTDYVPVVNKTIEKLAGIAEYRGAAQYLLDNGRQNEGKVFNDAGVSDHFAIIPTGQFARALSGDDHRLFDLVVRRFLGVFYPAALWEQVERTTVVAGEHFSSRARTLVQPGWRAVLEQRDGASDSKDLPPLVARDAEVAAVDVQNQSVTAEADQTKPPPRITEARLLSLMENAGKLIDDEDLAAVLHEKGLGTPATRSEIIENLKAKGYVDRNLRPTMKGIRLIDLLHRIHIGRITSAEMTGEMELHLNQVERGKRSREEFMNEVIEYTREIVEAARNFSFDELYQVEDPLGTCPCPLQRPVFERSWFYRCQEDPKCSGTDQDCPFRIWKDKSGRYIDRRTVTTLLRDGKTEELDGFLDRRGRAYKGILMLRDKEVVLQPQTGGEPTAGPGDGEAAIAVNPEPLGPCPIHKGQECQVIETPTDYICQIRQQQLASGHKRPVGVFLPRVVCKREITREEAIEFITTGTTPLIEDFISRFDRPFSARLKLGPDGRRVFEFPPRDGAPKTGKRAAKRRASTKSKPTGSKKTTAKKGRKPSRLAAAKRR
jgi:DNA topoisomerase-3